MRIFLTIFLCLMIVVNTEARPQYSMLSGNRCIACHTSYQGGALRNELGEYSRTSIFDFKGSATGDLIKKLKDFNSQFGGKLKFGADVRFQSAKLGGPEHSEREFFNMQAAPYVFVKPVSWFGFYGQYNFTPTVYETQNNWSAYMTIQPNYSYPQLKIGMIKPSIGNQYDDHTLLIRQIAGPLRATPVLSPDYTEYGSEITYDINIWINLTGGIYNSETMSNLKIKDESIVQSNSLSYLGRLAFTPRFFQNNINSNFGVSYYKNDDFSMMNLFFHLGWTDKISIIGEYLIADKKQLLKLDNYFVEILYHLFSDMDLSVRYENAASQYDYDSNLKSEFNTNQYVLGTNIYILSFVELRPEYRIYDREFSEGYHSQWTLQLHLYY